MSFNGAAFFKPQTEIDMARWEIHRRSIGIIEKCWWRWGRGPEISVAWPVGEIRIRQEPSGIWDYVQSANPNDHYRPWLEANVGRQGRDWIWGLRDNNIAENRLTIKFRKKHAKWATIATLQWS